MKYINFLHLTEKNYIIKEKGSDMETSFFARKELPKDKCVSSALTTPGWFGKIEQAAELKPTWGMLKKGSYS